jgi:hypothetical protein
MFSSNYKSQYRFERRAQLIRYSRARGFYQDNPFISHEWGKDREMFTTSGTYPWSFVTQIFHNGQPCHGDDRKFFEVMTSTLPKGTLGSVASYAKFHCFISVHAHILAVVVGVDRIVGEGLRLRVDRTARMGSTF